MLRKNRTTAALSIAAALAMVATACSGTSSSSNNGKTGSSSSSAQSANVNASGSPKKGGTLKIVGNADVDHLDTAAGYYTATYSLMRTYARQLFSYPASTNLDKATTPTPDIATDTPTTSNGGISSDGKTYTIHLRDGVMWDTSPARQVTADDVILGFKRLCNPTQNSVGAPGYYEGVIEGMDTYCAAFAKVAPTAPAFKAYIESNQISGIQAVNDNTVKFTLTKPAGDFINILALPFSSPAPVEYLTWVSA